MPILNWLNKDKATQTAATCAYRLLTEVPELSCGDKSSGNLIVQGDNLEALKALIPHYAGQVKCIFIDPPYNTGNAFDNYDDNLEVSIWLNLIYPRLELLWALLREDGYMVVQIDDNQLANLLLLMAEICDPVGLKLITVKMSEASGLKMGAVKKNGSIPKLKEHLIIAKKSKFLGFRLDLVPKQSWDSEYNILLDGFTRDNKAFIEQVSEKNHITAEDICTLDKMIATVEMKSVAETIKILKLKGKEKEQWLFDNSYRICQCAASKSVLELTDKKKENNSNNLFFVLSKTGILYLVRSHYAPTSKQPRIQMIFAEDNLQVHPGDLWVDIKTTGIKAEGKVDFKNGKKPEKLVQRIISLGTNKDDLVLDSFLGSGTTAAVAHKMGRRYIGVEIGEHAVTHCVPRLQAVIDGEQGGISKAVGWQGGGGFRFCRLGSAVFDGDGNISRDIGFAQLAAHIWYLETKQPLAGTANSPLLGEFGGRVYYLLFNGILGDRRPNGGNVLTQKILPHLPDFEHHQQQGKQIIIYGESCRLGTTRLQALNITFKQIPYDIGSR